MTFSNESLSVVVPVHNGQQTLPELVARLSSVLPKVSVEFELILVNDGSQDESWAVITEITRKHVWVRGIDLTRNFGQHNALLCGIREARNNVVVTMDDDLQHPPEEIHLLLDMLSRGFDVVYGKPDREHHGFWRNVASRLIKLGLRSVMGAKTASNVSAFRAFRTELREAFISFQGSFVSLDVLLSWGTTRFGAIRVNHSPRPLGPSNYTMRKLIAHAFNMITGFSVLPLQMASLMGVVFAFAGFLALVYVVGRYVIQGGSVPGFPFLASVVSILSGAQLLALGVIGEYLSRMYSRMMDRPTYSVRSSVGQTEGHNVGERVSPGRAR